MSVLHVLLIVCMTADPARCQDFQNPAQVAQVTHQVAVPAGPNTVVNTGTGRLITTIPIVSLPARGGMSIDFALTKVSDDGNTWWQSNPACGWRHSYQSWMAYSTAMNIYQWNSPGGSYGWTSNGQSFTRKPGNPYDLSTTTDGYRVTAKDGTVYEFTHQKVGAPYKYLTAIREPHGNQISLFYDNAQYPDIVTQIAESSGRHLHLNWYTNGYTRRLSSVTVETSSHSVVRTYTFTYPETSEFTKLLRITFPAPQTGAEQPFLAFEYSGGSDVGYRITKITTSGNNANDPDVVWDYTYDSTLHNVTAVTGPNATEGRNSTSATPASLRFHYPNNKVIGSYSYKVCRVLDALYTGILDTNGRELNPADRQHREVHLYLSGTGVPYSDFGPLITYIVGSQSTDDAASGSVYDPAATTAYPNSYYSKYVWNTGGTEYDCTLKSYTDPDGYTYQYKWYNDAGGNTTTDSRLNLWRITNPKNGTTNYTYHLPTHTHKYLLDTATDPGLHQTKYEYNTYHDVSAVHTDYTGLNLTEQNTYDPTSGNIILRTDAYGGQVQYGYDATDCFLTEEVDVQTGIVSEYGGYDVFGNKGWSRAPRHTTGPLLQTNYTYDKLGRLTRVTNPDTSYEQYTYDTNGNVLTARDANGEIVSYHYDNFGHADKVTSYAQIGSSVIDTAIDIEYCYDQLGQHKWTKWNRAGVAMYMRSTYDERNRLTKETLPGDKPGWFTYKYNGRGGTTQKSSGHGASTIDRAWTFAYDQLGQPDVDTSTYPAPQVTLANREYNSDGLLLSVQHADGYNVQYSYDSAHRERFCTTSYPGVLNTQKTIEHVYAAPPNRTVTTKVRNGGTTGSEVGTYIREYAANGRPTFLTSPTGSGSIKTGYEYESTTGLPSRVTYNTLAPLAASPYTTFAYDTTVHKRLWMTSLGNYRSDGSVISTFDYTYDDVGSRTRITEANGDYTDYGYDGSYTLRTEERKNASGSRIYKYEYQYDTAGNRTAKTQTNLAPGSPATYAYTYADNNLLTGVSGAATGTFDYDYSGNQYLRTTGGRTWSYAYDGANRLTQVSQTSAPTSNIAQFKYDALGRRIERTDAGGTRRYVYDGDTLVAEMDSNNVIIAWYTPGICESRYESGAWHTYYYCTDQLGTTRELVDDMQRVTDAYAYNAWGENLGQLRAPDDPNKPGNPLRYVGKEGYQSDDATGLMLLGARYYDPLIGRFITQDPICDGLNWYAYAENNPIRMVDPDGLKAQSGDPGEEELEAYGRLSGFQGFIRALKSIFCRSANDEQNADQRTIGNDKYTYKEPPGKMVVQEGWKYASTLMTAVSVVGVTDDLLKLATSVKPSTYRAVYQKFWKLSLRKDQQVHHIIPKQYREIVAPFGINIDDPRLLYHLQVKQHKKLNAAWTKFGQDNPNATAAQVLEFATDTIQQYKLYGGGR